MSDEQAKKEYAELVKDFASRPPPDPKSIIATRPDRVRCPHCLTEFRSTSENMASRLAEAGKQNHALTERNWELREALQMLDGALTSHENAIGEDDRVSVWIEWIQPAWERARRLIEEK